MTTFVIGLTGYALIALYAAFLDLTDRVKRPVFFFALGAASMIPGFLAVVLSHL